MRELAFLPPWKEHVGKLQTFRCVQGHEGDHALSCIGDLIGIGDKGNAFQESLDGVVFIIGPRLLRKIACIRD